MVMTAEATRENEFLESQYHKGVKHLCESGITRVPNKYILPAQERPNVTTGKLINASEPTTLKLPLIDFAELQGPNRAHVLDSLSYACQNYGFFQLVNHGIPSEVINNMRDVAARFFELPLVEREKYMTSNMGAPVRYGTSFNQSKDGIFCWRDFLKLVCHPLSDVLSHWPSSPLDFRKLAVTYAKETKLLFLMLVEAILESLLLGSVTTNKNKTEGVEEDGNGDGDGDGEDILKEFEDGSQLMIVNCYPPCPQPELTLGMPPHSDYGFLTLVLQDDVEGLQIQSQDKWVTIQPIPDSFVVNVGDHLEIFSNGRYKSVLHRVLVNSIKSRISVASLHSLPFTSKIRPLPELINETNPRRYEDTDFSDFLEYITSCDSKKKNFLESRKLT